MKFSLLTLLQDLWDVQAPLCLPVRSRSRFEELII